MTSFISIHELFKAAALEFSEQAKRWMPKWLTEHPALKAIKNTKVFKVFSVFGLNDFRQPVEDPSVVENFVDFLTNQFSHVVKELIRIPDSPEASELEQVSYKLLQEIIKPATWGNDKHRILAPVMSEDKKFRIDAGTSVVKAYNAIKIRAAKFGIILPELETTREFKEYSKRGKLTIVFSTNPEDIAAMSSRSDWGSCQTLDTVRGLNACVIGSVISKFIGICYVTSGKQFEERGETIVMRSLVRFVIDTQTNKPAIYLDKMYPAYYPQFAEMMIRALQAKTQVPVVNSAKLDIAQEFGRYRIPEEKISELPQHEKSYIDEPEYFSTKIKSEDETAPVKNVSAFYMHYKETVGALLGNALASFILRNVNIDRSRVGGANELRNDAISLGRRLIRNLVRPSRDRLQKYYDKQYKDMKWKPISIGFMKKIMFNEINKPGLYNNINQFIDYYIKKDSERDGEIEIFKRIILSNNLQEAVTKFLTDNVVEIAKQLNS